jgi:hypothetical protein
MDLIAMGLGRDYGLCSSDWGQGYMVGCCEYCNQLLGCIKYGEFFV